MITLQCLNAEIENRFLSAPLVHSRPSPKTQAKHLHSERQKSSSIIRTQQAHHKLKKSLANLLAIKRPIRIQSP
jgi:hypothetical protein